MKKKLRKNHLQRNTAIPTKITPKHFVRLPPRSRAIQVIFAGILFAREKNTPRSGRNTGKRKLAFFCPYFYRTGGEAKASPPKMTQNTAVPPRKVFAHFRRKCAFHSKSDRAYSAVRTAGAPLLLLLFVFSHGPRSNRRGKSNNRTLHRLITCADTNTTETSILLREGCNMKRGIKYFLKIMLTSKKNRANILV